MSVPTLSVANRRGLRFALSSTLFALPVLVIDNLPARSSHEADASEFVLDTPPPRQIERAVTTTTTPARPDASDLPKVLGYLVLASPPVAETTTTAPPTTAPEPTTTTTTAPPEPEPAPVEEAAPVAAPVNEQLGQATWYYWNPGECAHRTLPRGTVVTVTNLGTGAATTCVVTDRGPFGAGKIIDLDQTVFAQIAPLEQGVIDVRITW